MSAEERLGVEMGGEQEEAGREGTVGKIVNLPKRAERCTLAWNGIWQ